ncbi:MAG: squalene/phytoene synthase family protein [Rickettsiales endosymbiont of Dermacentor nuttalli]
MVNISLSYPAAQVKNFDNDRYLCSLFTTSYQVREQLFVIYTFNIELNLIKYRVNEEILGMVRLEWWREIIEDIYLNRVRRHPIIEPLSNLIRDLALDKQIFMNMIDAKEYSLGIKNMFTMEDFYHYVGLGNESILKIALDILGNTSNKIKDIVKDLAIVWSIIDTIKSIKPYMLVKNILMPEEIMQKHGIEQYMILEPKYKDNIRALICTLVENACMHLKEIYCVRHLVPRNLYAVFLLVTLSKLFIKRIKNMKYNIFDNNIKINRLQIQLTLLIQVLMKKF